MCYYDAISKRRDMCKATMKRGLLFKTHFGRTVCSYDSMKGKRKDEKNICTHPCSPHVGVTPSYSFCGCGDKAGTASGDGSQTANGGESSEPGKVYELKFTIHDPATSAKTIKYQELADEVYEATNGGVKITIYPGGSLAAAGDVAEAVKSGLADMGWLCTPLHPASFL
jgi:hypothetical protein